MHAERRLQQLHRKNQNIASEHGSRAQHAQKDSLTWFLEKRRDDSGRQELVRFLRRPERRRAEARAEALLPTYFQGPAGSMFVVVADALQLTASGELPDDELEAAPQTLAVEEDEELGHHPGEGGGGWGGGGTGIVSSRGPTSLSPISFTWKIRAEGAVAAPLTAVPGPTGGH